MGLRLRIVDPFPDEADLEPGMMWRYPQGDEAGRECWWIVLPNWKPAEPGLPDRISWRTTDRASAAPHEMWDVTGVAPNLTVTPSIDVECWRVGLDQQSYRDGSHWHGFLTNGELVG